MCSCAQVPCARTVCVSLSALTLALCPCASLAMFCVQVPGICWPVHAGVHPHPHALHVKQRDAWKDPAALCGGILDGMLHLMYALLRSCAPRIPQVCLRVHPGQYSLPMCRVGHRYQEYVGRSMQAAALILTLYMGSSTVLGKIQLPWRENSERHTPPDVCAAALSRPVYTPSV